MTKDPRHNGTTRRKYRAQALTIWRTNGNKCWLCGNYLDPHIRWPHPDALVADHITPIAHGGQPLNNVQPAHNRCNAKRGANSNDLPRTNTRQWGPPTLH